MRSDHDVGVGRIGPLRHPAALVGVLQQRLHHVVDALGGEQGQQAVFGAEGIPDRVGSVGNALVHLVVEGAVVVPVLGKKPWIQQRVIQRRVEDPSLRRIRAVDVEHAQLAVPGSLERIARRIEIPRRQFGIEVRPGLRQADERGADLRLDRLSRGQVEGNEGADVVTFDPGVAWAHQHAFVDALRRKRLLEAHHEIALELGQFQRPEDGVLAVGVVAANLVLLRVDLDIAVNARAGRLDEHAGPGLRRKVEAQVAAMVGRGDLRADAAAVPCVHRHGVAVRRGHLVRARERQLPRLGRVAQPVELRHQGDVTVVAHPDGGLVGTDETLDMRVGVVVRGDADPVLPRLCGPVGHAERSGHQRHGAAVLGAVAGGADIGVDPVDRRRRRRRREGGRRHRQQKQNAAGQVYAGSLVSHLGISSGRQGLRTRSRGRLRREVFTREGFATEAWTRFSRHGGRSGCRPARVAGKRHVRWHATSGACRRWSSRTRPTVAHGG